MASCLENTPRDILYYIVFLATTSAPLDAPSPLFSLLPTSSTIYRALSYKTCPHLYSSIFKTKFDLAAPTRRYAVRLTDSAFASEFIRRCRVLRRASRGDVSSDGLRQDLWTALWMIFESDGINESQLTAARFPSFILALLRSCAARDKKLQLDDPEYEVLSLTIWLLWLTYSRRDLEQFSLIERQELMQILRPFSLSKVKSNFYQYPDSILDQAPSTVSHYFRELDIRCVDPTIPAITLTFALNELVPLVAPPHFPATRAVALATQRSGPTLEDFQIMQGYRTSLFADSCFPSSPNSVVLPLDLERSLRNDLEFSSLLPTDSDFIQSSFYAPGQLTGVWEGTYMVAAPALPTEDLKVYPATTPDFTCRQPMQCAISEYLCFSPNLPVPTDGSWDITELKPGRLLELESEQGGFEICSRKYGYEKYVPASKVTSRRDSSRALDVIIVGETLDDHDQAWGGFKFTGRVRRDGLIILKREPKNADDVHLGTWFFEGRLNFERNFVGRWKPFIPSNSPATSSSGIFSMTKRVNTPEVE